MRLYKFKAFKLSTDKKLLYLKQITLYKKIILYLIQIIKSKKIIKICTQIAIIIYKVFLQKIMLIYI